MKKERKEDGDSRARTPSLSCRGGFILYHNHCKQREIVTLRGVDEEEEK